MCIIAGKRLSGAYSRQLLAKNVFLVTSPANIPLASKKSICMLVRDVKATKMKCTSSFTHPNVTRMCSVEPPKEDILMSVTIDFHCILFLYNFFSILWKSMGSINCLVGQHIFLKISFIYIYIYIGVTV